MSFEEPKLCLSVGGSAATGEGGPGCGVRQGVAGGPHGERRVGRMKGTVCRYKRGIGVQGFPTLKGEITISSGTHGKPGRVGRYGRTR